MRAELRRSILLACVGLLAGFALVVTLYGAGALFKRGLGTPAGSTEDAPNGVVAPLAGAPPAGPDGSTKQGARPGEGAGQPLGKPQAALEVRPGPERDPNRPPGGEAPSFDIIRIEPNGESVIAGRATPNTTVELLRDTVPIARALVDPSGQFAIVPPALPAGTSEITLRVTGADGQVQTSRDSVAVVVAPDRTAKPLVALTSPDKPTIVLSRPEPVTASAPGSGPGRPGNDRVAGTVPAGGAGPAAKGEPQGTADATKAAVKIVSVETEDGGRLYVTSQAQPGATVRLYLNDSLVAPGSAGADGRVAFTIGRGVRPGDYRVRVDQVDPVTGKVKARSEVAFAVPARLARTTPDAASAPDAGPVIRTGPVARADLPRTAASLSQPTAPKGAAPASPPAGAPIARPVEAVKQAAEPTLPATVATMPGPAAPAEGIRTVFVPEVGTARIVRGDNLWQISRRIYGRGTRYTVIFDANQPQIRNPDRIYPGQIFVLPSDGTATPQEGTRG